MMTTTLTPRAKRRKAIRDAIEEATRVSACGDTWLTTFDAELAKAGYKISMMTNSQLRQRAAEGCVRVEVAGAPQRS